MSTTFQNIAIVKPNGRRACLYSHGLVLMMLCGMSYKLTLIHLPRPRKPVQIYRPHQFVKISSHIQYLSFLFPLLSIYKLRSLENMYPICVSTRCEYECVFFFLVNITRCRQIFAWGMVLERRVSFLYVLRNAL
jgi:hypothetical protein